MKRILKDPKKKRGRDECQLETGVGDDKSVRWRSQEYKIIIEK